MNFGKEREREREQNEWLRDNAFHSLQLQMKRCEKGQTLLLMSSASSLAVLEATLSASNLPLKHSNVLKRSSSSIFFSLRKRDSHFTKCEKGIEREWERVREAATDRPTRTHLHFASTFPQAIISFPFSLDQRLWWPQFQRPKPNYNPKSSKNTHH